MLKMNETYEQRINTYLAALQVASRGSDTPERRDARQWLLVEFGTTVSTEAEPFMIEVDLPEEPPAI